MKLDDLTVTITGDPRSRASTNLRTVVELAIVGLGGSCHADGRLVSSFDLHGSQIIVQQRARKEPRRKKRGRR